MHQLLFGFEFFFFTAVCPFICFDYNHRMWAFDCKSTHNTHIIVYKLLLFTFWSIFQMPNMRRNDVPSATKKKLKVIECTVCCWIIFFFRFMLLWRWFIFHFWDVIFTIQFPLFCSRMLIVIIKNDIFVSVTNANNNNNETDNSFSHSF